MFGRGYLSVFKRLFTVPKSSQNRGDPSFLCAIMTGTPYGDFAGLMTFAFSTKSILVLKILFNFSGRRRVRGKIGVLLLSSRACWYGTSSGHALSRFRMIIGWSPTSLFFLKSRSASSTCAAAPPPQTARRLSDLVDLSFVCYDLNFCRTNAKKCHALVSYKISRCFDLAHAFSGHPRYTRFYHSSYSHFY